MTNDSNKSVELQKSLKDSTRQISDVVKLMRTQRDMLRQRGMNLPQGSLEDLRTLKKQVDRLSTGVLNNQVELRSLRALAETTALINSSQSREEVLNQVMDTVIALTGAERGYIVLKNEETDELEFMVARGMSQEDGGDNVIISRSIVNRVADTGEPVLTDNASEDKRYQQQESIVGFALRSILAVPLKVRDKVIGVVYTDNRFMSGLFKQAELEILNAFAAQAAVAIENAQLFENSRLSLQQVTEVRDLMDNIFTSITSAIIVLSHQDNIVVSNAAAETILDSNAIIGKSWDAVFPELSNAFTEALAAARNGAQTSLIEQPVLHGSERYWTVIVSPLQGDNNGMGGGVTIVLDDMTKQHLQDAQVAEVRRYLPLALIESVKSVDDINLGGQEREITALFADIRGFTTFSERLEPEELMRVINQYLSLASDAINLYEGIVDKYMGDAVTGLWNTQLNPQPDHASRAVQAALQLVLDLRAHHETVTEENRLFYGIGIHSGPAVLGNVGGKGRKEFAALGEATNICKYLQEQAGEAEIIISEATYELVKDDFECERRTEIVRHKAGYEDIAFYVVLQRKKTKKRTPSPFVDEELLAMLGDEFES